MNDKTLQIRHIILIIFCLVAFVSVGFTQSIKIKGKVLDADTKETLPFANVRISGETMGVAADVDGNYEINVPKNTKSITASMVGFDTLARKVNPALDSLIINFELKVGAMMLSEVVIHAGENPANIIVKGIIRNKSINRPSILPNYECESYSKTEFDMINIDKNVQKSAMMKPFKFIFDNIDTTSDEKPFLPVYMVEVVSKDFHIKNKTQNESAPIAQKVAGDPNESLIAFVRDLQKDYDVYDDWIYMLEKPFVSPFANNGLFYYDYYISDTTIVNGKNCFNLRFKPKRKQETTFFGDFWVVDSTFAIQKVNMRMSPDVNINLINRIILFQSFAYNTEKKAWFPEKTKTILDFQLTRKSPGMIGRKSVFYNKFEFKKDSIESYTQKEAVTKKAEDSPELLQKEAKYWDTVRPEILSKTESSIYTMVDSLEKVPVYRTYVDIINTIVYGYKDLGAIEVGPYFSAYSYNTIEGNRFRLGVRTTPKFNDKLRLGAFLAYGTKDQAFKYGGNFQWNIKRNPRTIIGAAFAKDVSSNSTSSESINLNDATFLTGIYRRPVLQKLIKIQELKAFYEHYLRQEWSVRATFLNRTLAPFQQADGTGFNYAFLAQPENILKADSSIRTTEAIIKLRYSRGEKFIDGVYSRTQVGDQNPIAILQYTIGTYGKVYHKVEAGLKGYFDINPIGRTNYHFSTGKTFGTAPFLLLHIAQGNETYSYESSAFNAANRYEFVADTYASLYVTHHFQGLILNKIPLLRKLKWREVASFKAFWGTMTNDNLNANQHNLFDLALVSPNKYAGFRVPSKVPYMESSIGIENIFKVLRIDAVWRVNYLDNIEARPFALHVGLDFNF